MKQQIATDFCRMNRTFFSTHFETFQSVYYLGWVLVCCYFSRISLNLWMTHFKHIHISFNLFIQEWPKTHFISAEIKSSDNWNTKHNSMFGCDAEQPHHWDENGAVFPFTQPAKWKCTIRMWLISESCVRKCLDSITTSCHLLHWTHFNSIFICTSLFIVRCHHWIVSIFLALDFFWLYINKCEECAAFVRVLLAIS